MKSYERRVCRIKIFCKTVDCMNPSGGHKSNHRNVKDFSKKSIQAAIESFKSGIRINSTTDRVTQDKWRKTTKGWLCPECK